MLVLGAGVYPILPVWLPRYRGLAWIMAKIAAVAFLSYLAFWGAVLHLFPFERLTFLGLFLLTLGLVNWRRWGWWQSFSKMEMKTIVVAESVFFLTLLAWSWLRGFQPNIYGLEKFMDFGFLNSLLRSHWLPPLDPWFAGHFINYYYFGHLEAAFLGKFSGLAPAVIYNLLLATIFALVFVGAASLVIYWLQLGGERLPRRFLFFGLLVALLLTLGGNLHPAVFVLKDGPHHYWYPNATRFIGYYPDNPHDRTIHEFPAYSLVVADLHAHLNDLPNVILFLFFLSNFYLLLWQRKKITIPWLLSLAILLAILLMTNAWDFPIYGGLFALVTFWPFWRRRRLTSWFWRGLLLLGFSFLAASPFLYYFHPLGQGLAFCHYHSFWWQLLILWGFFLGVSLSFWLSWPGKKKRALDWFILSLSGWAVFLVLLPEIIYVRDIYEAGYPRANTMFKLTYQAFVLFSLTGGYIFWRLGKSWLKKFWRGSFLLFFLAGFTAQMIYPFFAIPGYYGRLSRANYQGLRQGLGFFRRQLPDDYQVYRWLIKHFKRGQPLVLEAAGQSYTLDNRLSATTGFPTIEGWLIHEWLWRGGYQLPSQRQHEVEMIYQGKNLALAHYLLLKYRVAYVLVGQREREKYPHLDEQRFRRWGKLVFQAGKSHLYQLTRL